MKQTDPTADFDGCRRACRQQGAHTLVRGECEHAPEPEPTVSLSSRYVGPDGVPGIAFDRYTVPELAELITAGLRASDLPVDADDFVDIASVAAYAIVHRNDEPAAASAVVSPPTDRAALRDRIAETLWSLDWDVDQLNAEAAADAVLAVLPEPTGRAAVARVRALHQQYTFGDGTTDYCAHCNQIRGGWVPWPCPTVRALDVELAVEAQSCRWEHPHPGYQCEPRTTVEAHGTGTQQQDGEAQDEDEALRAKVDEATATLRRVRSKLEMLKDQGATGRTYYQVITEALAGPHPDEPAPVAQQPAAEAHSCSNCEGVDPDTCLANPDRQQPAAADGEETRVCRCGHGKAYHDAKYADPQCRLCPEDGERSWRHPFTPADAAP